MTELERRALLGDKQAQEECTRQGIVLPCPKCYGKVKISGIRHDGNRMEMNFECQNQRCKLKQTFGQWRVVKGIIETTIDNPAPLLQWNTRPAPPIGRCKDCEYYTLLGHCKIHSQEPDEYGPGAYVEMLPDDFCSYFEPRHPDAT